MKIRIAPSILHETLVNGEGIRSCVFFAGCNKYCKGCHNKDLQKFNAGIKRNIDDVVDEILKNRPMIDGVTLSGGDPLCQYKGSLELCKKLKEHDINIWLYTGELYTRIKTHFSEILDFVDVIVDGKFDESLVSDKIKYRGSSNQKIIYFDCGYPTKIIQGDVNGYE